MHRGKAREETRDAGTTGVAPNRRHLPVAAEAKMSSRVP